MKHVTPEVKAAVDSGAPRVQLLRMELRSGTIFLTTCGHDIEWQGDTYFSTGLILEVSRVRQNSEIRVGTRALTYTVADSSILAEVSNYPQVNRLITQYEAYLNPFGQIIPDPIHKHTWLYSGDRLKGSQLEVSMSNEWVLFETTSGRRTTMESQRRFYPDDLVFNFTPNASKEVIWGD